MFKLPRRFWSKVTFRGPVVRPGIGRCWVWIAAKDRYGRYSVGSRMALAHRLVLEGKLRRPLGPGLFACHKCDNPACVCPFHLFEGTPAQNVADMTAKGRATRLGEANPYHKLTEEKVRAIRAAVGTQEEIAGRFGVNQTAVSKIWRRETWRHVT
jgi:hypothetical protein